MEKQTNWMNEKASMDEDLKFKILLVVGRKKKVFLYNDHESCNELQIEVNTKIPTSNYFLLIVVRADLPKSAQNKKIW